MPSDADWTLDSAMAVVDRATLLAAELLELRKERVAVNPALRHRVGDRDGWVCCICDKSVDPALKLIQVSRATAAAHRAHLRQFGARDRDAVAGWVDGDAGRAGAALSWFYDLDLWLRREPDEDGYFRGPSFPPGWEEFRSELRGVLDASYANNRATQSVEHLVPVALGGGNSMDNLAIAHLGCNSRYRSVGSATAELFAARAHARGLVEEFGKLRNGYPADTHTLLHDFELILRVRAAIGLAGPDEGVLGEDLARSLVLLSDRYGPLWAARTRCMDRVRALAETNPAEVRRLLREQIKACEQKIGTLTRASSVTLWTGRRDAATATLAAVRADPEHFADLRYQLKIVPGLERNAAWWNTQCDAMPEPWIRRRTKRSG